MSLENINWHEFGLSMVALIICISIHEFSHALAAVRAGDDTPRKQGRISLNPIDHLDPIGTLMMAISSLSGFGFGWGKPVQINYNNFRNFKWDNFKVSLWGPLSNLLTAAVIGVFFFRFYVHTEAGLIALSHGAFGQNLVLLLVKIVEISIVLALFNLIPIGPLDGSHILASLLPDNLSQPFRMFMYRYGMIIFLGLIFLTPGLLPRFIGPPVTFLWHLFTGLYY